MSCKPTVDHVQWELAQQFRLPTCPHRMELSWPTSDTSAVPQSLDLLFTSRLLFLYSLSGFESNRVVKQQRLLTRESECSNGLVSGSGSNHGGWARPQGATLSELKLAPRSTNRRKPLKISGFSAKRNRTDLLSKTDLDQSILSSNTNSSKSLFQIFAK